MKKTLIITLEFPPHIGGIATYVDSLASALVPEQTIVMAPPAKNASEWDKTRPYRIIRRRLLSPRFIWPRWLTLIIAVYRIARREKIELVMIHHVLPVGYAAWFLKKTLKIPYLVFSHGTDVLAGTKNAWKQRMMRGVARSAECLIFNSESLRRRFLRVLPEFEAQSLVLYPCPDEDFFVKPDESVLENLRRTLALEGKQVVLSIARLAEGKGFPHLTRILAEVVKTNPNLVWVIIGTGPKEAQVIADIQKNSLQNIVRFIGEVPHAAMKPYYYLADLFVLLTHPDEGREEGLGLVFLEAAAAGRPAIAGKSGGVEEGIVHTHTGLVFDVYHEAPHIAKAIIELLENKDYAERLGQQAQERLRADFNWKNQLQKLGPWLMNDT